MSDIHFNIQAIEQNLNKIAEEDIKNHPNEVIEIIEYLLLYLGEPKYSVNDLINSLTDKYIKIL